MNKDWLRAFQNTARIEDDRARILPLEFDDVASMRGDAPALISERESFTFRQLMERSNQYARWAIAQNLRVGDAVCLMMGNRAEYVAIWLGLNRVGVVVALLNTNLLETSLADCIAASRARHIIVAKSSARSAWLRLRNGNQSLKSSCMGMATIVFRASTSRLRNNPGRRSPNMKSATLRCRIARSIFTRPERRDCRKRRSSPTAAS